jgi:hypothetical protein
MADKKISALTAAATPLDGTEVLPIVQSGATVKVANNDLRPKQIQSNATSGVLQVVGPAAAATRVATVPDANFTVARTDAAQSFTGNQTLSTGNLIIGTSGQGIDFSATPGTGTSELLADYEEGTWTPVVTASVGSITTVGAVSGTYTKVGRLCTLTFDIAITVNGTGSSSINMAGAPFTALIASFGSGSEVNLTGKMLNVNIATSATVVNFAYYDATYPGANLTRFKGTVTYPV